MMKKLCLSLTLLLSLLATSCGGLRDLSSRHVDGRVVGRRTGYLSAIEIENILKGAEL